MFSETVTESTLGLADVQEPTLGTLDAADEVRGGVVKNTLVINTWFGFQFESYKMEPGSDDSLCTA